MNAFDQDVARFLLAMARFAPWLMVPAFTPLAWVPATVRVIVLLALSVTAFGAHAAVVPTLSLDDPLQFGLSLIGETLFGLTFAVAIALPAAALGFSTRIVDMQSGIAAASLLNPSTHTTESLVGTLVQWGGMVVFFAAGLHLVLLRGLMASMELVPLGSGGWLLSPSTFLGLLSSQFLLGLMVVLPVILGLFAIDLATAYASRSMPQANIYFVAMPLKLLAAIGLMAASLQFAPALIERLYRDAFAALSTSGGH